MPIAAIITKGPIGNPRVWGRAVRPDISSSKAQARAPSLQVIKAAITKLANDVAQLSIVLCVFESREITTSTVTCDFWAVA